jgi:hypothetical protein
MHTGVPELRKSSISCLLLKISTFSFFFLDDSCVSTAHLENFAVYIQVSQYLKKTLKLFKRNLPGLI